MLDELAVFDALFDMMIHRADAGRWGAGLMRRAVSIALLLIALVAAAAQSWRSQARHLIERLDVVTPLRHVSQPPSRWAGA